MTREERLQDIKEHPERHRHSFEGLQRCCMTKGHLDLELMEAHSRHAPVGTNGARRCDTTSGPCSCGAWH